MKLKFARTDPKEDIEAANETKRTLSASCSRSRRHVSIWMRREHLDPEIKTVGVFVNDEPELISPLVRDEVIDIIQLHGGEACII